MLRGPLGPGRLGRRPVAGPVVVANGALKGEEGRGKFLKRETADYARMPRLGARYGQVADTPPALDRSSRRPRLRPAVSARLLMTDPGASQDVHLAYFRAGARVAITASYQATVPGFAAAGLDRAQPWTRSGAASTWPGGRDRATRGDFAVVSIRPRPVAGMMQTVLVFKDWSEYRGDRPAARLAREVRAPHIDGLLTGWPPPPIRSRRSCEAEVLVRRLEERISRLSAQRREDEPRPPGSRAHLVGAHADDLAATSWRPA